MMTTDRPTPRPSAAVDQLPPRRASAEIVYLRPVEPTAPGRDVPTVHGQPVPGDEVPADAFETILFPPGYAGARIAPREQPACYTDLNLDQIVAGIVEKRDEAVLRPILYASYRDEEVVLYRQAVFKDLEHPDIYRPFPAFSEAMRAVRANLDYAATISYRRHQHMVLLRAILIYCDAVDALLQSLTTLTPESAGLKALRAYLARYVASEAFERLSVAGRDLRRTLSEITYGTLFRGDKITVRKYASEPDYTVTILERFARFRESDVKPPAPPRTRDDFSLNHIEEGILEFVGRLFKDEFRALEEYVEQHKIFIDEVIARFDREIGFFIAYLAFIAPMKAAGLAFCHPTVSTTSKDERVVAGFDLALATKLVRENRPIVCNDFFLHGAERLIVVSGPNQGGKTTFARMFGQLHVLAGLGCPVPGQAARLFLPDRVFTHFEREETITNLRGKLEDELVRFHHTYEAMTSDSVVVLNEVFNSTSVADQVFLSTKVLQHIIDADAIGLCVTFIDGLSTLSETTVSMVSTVMPDDPASRTFEIVRKPADGLAYALSLAERRGVTYERLRWRMRPLKHS